MSQIASQPLPGPIPDPSNPMIELIIGAGAVRDFYLLDEQDQPENLTGVTEAILTIKRLSTDTIPVLQKSTVAGTLVTVASASKFTATFTSTDTGQMSPGTYIADIAVQIAGIWYNTVSFEVAAVIPVGVGS